MQASLDVLGLKSFIKALTCLSRYGDDLIMHATPESMSLSCTNSAMSAYCSFKYAPEFFTRYGLGVVRVSRAVRVTADNVQELTPITSQLLTKSLLSVLRHRNLEKNVDKCELSIIEGSDEPGDEADSLESRLVVRLHCKHGVVKTHRLLLNTPTNNFVPLIPDAPTESRINASPQTVRDIIEQFPHARSGGGGGGGAAKGDPQLSWRFDAQEVRVKSVGGGVDAKRGVQLSTEMIMSADEFDVYDVYSPPTTLGFHLREFNASITFVESQAMSVDLRFTEPADPLFITATADDCELLAVISTFHARGAAEDAKPALEHHAHTSSAGPAAARKRGRDEASGGPPMRKTARVVEKARVHTPGAAAGAGAGAGAGRAEPLFLPASQMSAAEEAVVRGSGLGIEDMDADEFAAMLEGEGEEVVPSQRPRAVNRGADAEYLGGGSSIGEGTDEDGEEDSRGGDIAMGEADGEASGDGCDVFDALDEDEGWGATQLSGGDKAFKRLFED